MLLFNNLVDAGKITPSEYFVDPSSVPLLNSNMVHWTKDGKNRWVLNGDVKQWATENTGKILWFNGVPYQLTSYTDATARRETGTLNFKNLLTGAHTSYNNTGGNSPNKLPTPW
jgi:hypothetical protein